MSPPFHKLMLKTQRGELSLLVLLPLTLTIIVGVVGWYGLTSVEHTLKEQAGHEIQNTLKAAQAGLHLWAKNMGHEVESWVTVPEVRTAIMALAHKTTAGDMSIDSLKASTEFTTLRTLIGPFTQRKQHVGFIAFDQSGLQIVALLEDPVGRRDLTIRSDFVKRALAGETVVSAPFPGEVDLPDSTGALKPDQPTMFSVAPVRDETGAVIGALGFRLRPNLGFSEMLQTFQNGKTGEIYAFNADGLLLSESRFIPDLKHTGLLPADAETAILKTHIRDPGENFIEGIRSKIPPEQRPLTKMAASAITGQTGQDLEGYRDYRGVPVIGAWIWLEHYGFGLASEMDVSEAYASLDEIRSIFLGIIGLLISGSIISGGLFLKERRESAARKRSEVLLRRYEKIVAGSDDFLAFIDTEYKYRAINATYLKAFGKKQEEIIGQTGEALFGTEMFETLLKPAQTRCLNGEYVAYERWVNLPILGRRCMDVHYIPFNEPGAPVTGMVVTVRDTTERKQIEEQLQYSQFAIDQIADYVYWVTSDARFLYVNKAACARLGYTQDELLSLTVFDINPHFPKENWPSFWTQIREQHSLLFESQHCTKEGTVFPIEINVTHLEYEGQSYNCAVVRDITERKKNEQQLRESEARYRQLNAELEQRVSKRTEELQFSNKELEAFSYSVSHDLRAPLRAINGFGKALLDDYGHQLSAEGQRYLAMIRDQAQSMGILIDDLLAFSRLSRKSMHATTIDMTMLFRDVFQTAKTQQDLDRRIQINIGSLPPAHADRSLLMHAIENLMTNALKFTSGKPTMVLDVNSQIEGSEVVYSIKDNGVGFDMAYVDKLFGVFQRLHTQEEFEGTGVGLALVQRIISRHGGRVWAEGKVNEGATFYFTLPKGE